jgi:hypothetical protein
LEKNRSICGGFGKSLKESSKLAMIEIENTI